MKALFRLLHAPIYRARLTTLADAIVPHLHDRDRVLDVGCGSGMLASAMLTHARCPAGLHIEGLEQIARGNEPIPVTQNDGTSIPFDDDSFDVVTIADVLHHEHEPEHLLRECARVAQRAVIIKDHKPEGLLAQQRIALMDWAANIGYSVPCLYRYNTIQEWHTLFASLDLSLLHEVTSMQTYPPLVNLFFGRRLQYLAVVVPEPRTVHVENSYSPPHKSDAAQ